MANVPMTVTAQQTLNYLCSRARAATKEAQSLVHQQGPNEYYQQWLKWIKLELEVVETIVGCMILKDKFNHVPPFLKKLQFCVNSKKDLISFKASLLKLNPTCLIFDPTRIVDRYPNSWWAGSNDTPETFNPVEGCWEFSQQPSDDHTQLVAPSFESRIHLDSMGAQISSILAMNFLHTVTGEFLMDYTEGTEDRNEEACSDMEYELDLE